MSKVYTPCGTQSGMEFSVEAMKAADLITVEERYWREQKQPITVSVIVRIVQEAIDTAVKVEKEKE